MTNAKHGCDRKIAVVVYIFGHKIAPSVHRLSHTKHIEDIFLVSFSWQFRNVLKQILKHRHKIRTKLLNITVSLVVLFNK